MKINKKHNKCMKINEDLMKIMKINENLRKFKNIIDNWPPAAAAAAIKRRISPRVQSDRSNSKSTANPPK